MGFQKDGQYGRRMINQARRFCSSHVPFKNNVRVSLWEATHCNSAKALQTLLEAAAVSCEGFNRV